MDNNHLHTKLKVLIDFEAISQPFSRDLKLPELDYPYAYTLALVINNKYKSKTRVIITKYDIFTKFQKAIEHDVRLLTKNDSFRITAQSTVFIGWNPFLENKILKRCFKNIEVRNLNSFENQSLAKLSQTHFPIKNYYNYFVPLLFQNTHLVKLLMKRNFNNGLVAAVAGYCLFCLKYNLKKQKFLPSLPIDKNKLLKEVYNYSYDDVHRMELYFRYPGILYQQASQVHYRQLILKVNQNLMNNFKTLKKLQLQAAERKLNSPNATTKDDIFKKITILERKQNKLVAELSSYNDKINNITQINKPN